MPERRSSRAKKTIKYTGYDELSDDDFAETSPAPPKKQKMEKSSSKKEVFKDQDVSVGKTVADLTVMDSGKKRRTPLSDKVYERELQQALEISLLQSQGSQDLQKTKSSPTLETHGENSKPTAAFTVKDVPGVVVDEEIEVHPEATEKSSTSRERSSRADGKMKNSKAASKGISKVESDDCSDYASDSDDDSEDSFKEEESGEDSDFSPSPKPSNKKKSPFKKTETNSKRSRKETTPKTAPRDKKLPVAAKPGQSSLNEPATVEKSKASKSNLPSSPAAVVSRAATVPSSLTSSWKPPALAKSVSPKLPVVRSPTSGLRLGLSRNQRVKPLHPSVHVS